MENDRYIEELNSFLVDVFNGILKTEELYVTANCPDLSLREIHLIEEVCRAVDQGRDNRASAMAAALRVTAGTLTAAVNQLEGKGYLERARDGNDKRSVRLLPTQKGRQAMCHHRQFHLELVAAVVDRLSPEEAEVLLRSLGGIASFFQERCQGQNA